MRRIDRRGFLLTGLGVASAAVLSGCGRIASSRAGQSALQAGEDASKFVQRLLLKPQQLAPEYSKADISKVFKPNGSTDPGDETYKTLAAAKFANYRLKVSGLVEQPFELSLEQMRALPARTQITRHDCVEGWSCIAEWTGVPLADILQRAKLKPQARYVVFRCFDSLDEGSLDPSSSRYYESVDLVDAFHPQTILAHTMNGAALPIEHGAPLRLRVERQLGYKMAKYVSAIEVVDAFDGIQGGHGGYWEDQGYDWYAGI